MKRFFYTEKIAFGLLSVALLLTVTVANPQKPEAAAQAAPVIRMGGDFAYPPYEFLGSNGQALGFNVSLMREVAKASRISFRAELGPWPEQISALENGEVNVLAMFYSPLRNQRFDFSIPFAVVNHVLFIRSDSAHIDSLNDLIGRSVLVQKGSFAQDYLSTHLPQVRLILTTSESEALKSLSAGDFDVAIVGQSSGNYLKESLGLHNILSSGPPILTAKYCFVVRRGDKDLLDLINAGLAKIQATGTYDDLYWRWLSGGSRLRFSKILSYALLGVTGLLFALLLVTLWSRSLKRQVKLKTAKLDAELAERHRYEQERSTLIQQLSGALHAREQFISIASHELRTPLTPLRAQFQLVELGLKRLKNGDFSQIEQLFKYTRGADRQLDRITRLVNNLLDVATVKSGQLLSLKKENCSLASIAKEVIERFSAEIQSSGSKVRLDVKTDTTGFWDPLRIEQVITNLLTNALKYGKGSEIAIKIDHHDGTARLEVRDHGPGIQTEKLPKLFDPFERAVSEGAVDGLGLGLYITRQIVLSHGGMIDIVSEPGDGTNFIVELPKYAEAQEQDSMSQNSEDSDRKSG